MATPIVNNLSDNSTRDNTGDKINGSEVDVNPVKNAAILDGTSEIMLNQDTGATNGLRLRVPESTDISTAAGGVRTAHRFRHDPPSGTVTDDDGVEILFQGDNDAGTKITYGEVEVVFTDVNNATGEDATINFKAMTAGTSTTVLSVSGTAATLTPPALTLAASTTITVPTGGPLNFALSSASGDDFRVDANKFVVEGDTGYIGVGRNDPVSHMDVTAATLDVGYTGGNTTSDANEKFIGYMGNHYTNSEPPIGAIYVHSKVSSSEVNIGGGASAVNAATVINFWTGATHTETTGTNRLSLSNTGQLDLLADGRTDGYTGGSSTSDATRKELQFSCNHYTNSEPAMCGIYMSSNSGTGELNIGGGTGSLNAAYTIDLWTGTTATTTTGGQALSINGLRCVGIGTGQTFGNGTGVFHLGNTPNLGSAPTNAMQLTSVDLSAGNTMLALQSEGTGSVGSGTPTQDTTFAIQYNGTTYYLLASTSAS